MAEAGNFRVRGLKFFLSLPILAKASALRQITDSLDAVMNCPKTAHRGFAVCWFPRAGGDEGKTLNSELRDAACSIGPQQRPIALAFRS
jgi:hypothetical protein